MDNAAKLAQVKLTLNGRVVSSPELVSRFKGTKVLSVNLENRRLSGGVDTFNVHFSNSLGVIIEEGMYIEVTGDIRTMNARDSDHVIYQFVMASDIKVLKEEPKVYKNDVEIVDAELMSFEGVRKSYSDDSKTLATYRICVRRKHGRCSYFRVTSWGRDSIFLGNIYRSVKYMHLKCRLQSFTSSSSGKLRFCLVSYYLEVPESEKKDIKDAEDTPAVEESPEAVAEQSNGAEDVESAEEVTENAEPESTESETGESDGDSADAGSTD